MSRNLEVTGKLGYFFPNCFTNIVKNAILRPTQTRKEQASMQSTIQASAFEQLQLKYLQRLAEQYPTIDKAAVEIINLQAILNLPKGTEHFITDIHGEYEALSHLMKKGSGSVKKKIDEVFGHT